MVVERVEEDALRQIASGFEHIAVAFVQIRCSFEQIEITLQHIDLTFEQITNFDTIRPYTKLVTPPSLHMYPTL